jgi:energy-coupling factor transport system ATP-binding protein
MNGSGPAIRVSLREVSYAYVGTSAKVLEGIDLDLSEGRIVGVVGANEAGKSTLCLVAAGLAPVVIGGHLEGSVEQDGIDTRTSSAGDLGQRVGILFQNPVTQLSGTSVTVYEEIAFGPRNLGLPLGEAAARVEWAAELVGVRDLLPRDPARLSGGQAQLVALGSVLALRPATLVLDEPTSQLDPLGTRLVGDALADLASETGTAILIVEHKTDLLARMADEVLVLAGGKIVKSGVAAEVLADPDLPALGVEPPSDVRLQRAFAQADIALDPSWSEASGLRPTVGARQ